MAEARPSQNKQIIDKLDSIEKKITRIEAQIEYQPKIDFESRKAIEERIEQNQSSINQLENNQRWLVLSVIAIVISAVMQLVIT